MVKSLQGFFSAYLRFAEKHRLLCFLLFILLIGVSVFTASGLKLKSSLKELLPEKSSSVMELDRMLKRVGGVSVLTVAVESPNVQANMKFVDDLDARLNNFQRIRFAM